MDILEEEIQDDQSPPRLFEESIVQVNTIKLAIVNFQFNLFQITAKRKNGQSENYRHSYTKNKIPSRQYGK